MEAFDSELLINRLNPIMRNPMNSEIPKVTAEIKNPKKNLKKKK